MLVGQQFGQVSRLSLPCLRHRAGVTGHPLGHGTVTCGVLGWGSAIGTAWRSRSPVRFRCVRRVDQFVDPRGCLPPWRPSTDQGHPQSVRDRESVLRDEVPAAAW